MKTFYVALIVFCVQCLLIGVSLWAIVNKVGSQDIWIAGLVINIAGAILVARNLIEY